MIKEYVCLFVGGPENGMRLKVKTNEFEELPPVMKFKGGVGTLALINEYKRCSLKKGGESIYIHSSLTEDAAISLLIANYQP